MVLSPDGLLLVGQKCTYREHAPLLDDRQSMACPPSGWLLRRQSNFAVLQNCDLLAPCLRTKILIFQGSQMPINENIPKRSTQGCGPESNISGYGFAKLLSFVLSDQQKKQII